MRARGVSRGNIRVILKVAILNIRPGDSTDFEYAFAEAQAIIASIRAADGAFSGLLKRMNGCGHPGVGRGNITMILEVAILNTRPGESADFERAFAEAQAIIASMVGCGWGRSADY
jgi:heme-degrading monooxygenase HmoA